MSTNIARNNNKRQLPTLADLNKDVELAFKNDQLNLLLNQEPKIEWLKDHPYVKNGNQPYKYLPVDKVEHLLTLIFQRWEWKVKEFCQLFNSVCVHGTLRVKDPITGEWIEQDGLGAVGVQTDSGANASDMSRIKSDAVMKALPAAESYALKDAAEKLGKLFGKDLNKKDTLAFSGFYNTDKQNSAERNRVTQLIEEATSLEHLTNELWQAAHDNGVLQLFNEKRKALGGE